MLQNLHTHCTFCDGKNTPEEIIEEAIKKGFDSIGFSSHATSDLADTVELADKEHDYHKNVSLLKTKYADKIKIFLGLELDRYSEGHISGLKYDYAIGSVHYTDYRGEAIIFDYGKERTKNYIDTLFGGDEIKYARLYYETLAEMPRHIKFDFVGHFDLLTKYCELDTPPFNQNSREYKDVALTALHALREQCEFFEVNTGAVARGYRKTPYPAPFILDEMKKLSCKLILTSDCHNKNYLDCYFKESRELLLAHGINELYYLTDNGFVGEKIKI